MRERLSGAQGSSAMTLRAHEGVVVPDESRIAPRNGILGDVSCGGDTSVCDGGEK